MRILKKHKASKKRSLKRPGRGTLVLISALLMSSAFIRLGNDAGQAFAKQAETVAPQKGELPLPMNQTCEPAPDIAKMLAAFKEREERLTKQEFNIKSRTQALRVADKEVTQKLAALIQAEEELRKTLALSDAAAENDLSKLTSVYENMKPKDAAALFEEMDPSFAAGFLGRMQPGAAASIMAGLEPKTAYTISAILAGRNADVPKE